MGLGESSSDIHCAEVKTPVIWLISGLMRWSPTFHQRLEADERMSSCYTSLTLSIFTNTLDANTFPNPKTYTSPVSLPSTDGFLDVFFPFFASPPIDPTYPLTPVPRLLQVNPFIFCLTCTYPYPEFCRWHFFKNNLRSTEIGPDCR